MNLRGRLRKKIAFGMTDLGAKQKGSRLSTRIGFTKVSKRPNVNLFTPRKFKRELLREPIEGHNLLKKHNLPVTNFIRKRRRKVVFEKARTITRSEVPKYTAEIERITEEAIRKGINFDNQIQNFGINKEGKLVIRDTNIIGPFHPSAKKNQIGLMRINLNKIRTTKKQVEKERQR